MQILFQLNRLPAPLPHAPHHRIPRGGREHGHLVPLRLGPLRPGVGVPERAVGGQGEGDDRVRRAAADPGVMVARWL